MNIKYYLFIIFFIIFIIFMEYNFTNEKIISNINKQNKTILNNFINTKRIIDKENNAPIAKIKQIDKTNKIIIGELVKLVANISDQDGDLLKYKWYLYKKPKNSLLNSKGASKLNYNFIVDKSGEYIIQFIVIDSKGLWDSDNYTINVEEK